MLKANIIFTDNKAGELNFLHVYTTLRQKLFYHLSKLFEIQTSFNDYHMRLIFFL